MLTKGDVDLGQNEVPLLFLLLLSYFFRSPWQVLLLDGGILIELGKLSFLLILLSHVSFLLSIS